MEEAVAQKSAVESEREALKGKLRSATVSAKELGKDLTVLRHKHEATVGRMYIHTCMQELQAQKVFSLDLFLSVCAHAHACCRE